MSARYRSKFERERLRRAAQSGTFRSLGHAVATIRKLAMGSIRRIAGRSAVGQPPHTHTNRLPKAILFAVEKPTQSAVVGPSRRIVGLAGAEQEHGGRWRKELFAPRPFMAPALEKVINRLPSFWAGSVR